MHNPKVIDRILRLTLISTVYAISAMLITVFASVATGKSDWLPGPLLEFFDFEKVETNPEENSKVLAGPPGPRGEIGPIGPQGERGERGLTGPRGQSGNEGAKGDLGPEGPRGEVGSQGPQGLQGEMGPQGAPGATGATGAMGPVGPQGGTGPQGATGATGATGPQGTQGAPGATGATGPQGPAGGFGSYGSFYDTSTIVLNSGVATPVPLNVTAFANGVSVIDNYKISLSQSGKYNIAFSSQLYNSSNQERLVVIWLSKNGIASSNWIEESSTDLYLGKDTLSERAVAAWNFFVEAMPGEYYVLMIATNGAGVSIYGDPSAVTSPPGIPLIPSTILTVNQIG